MQILSQDDLPESFICVGVVVGGLGKERANVSPIVAKYELNRFDFSSSFTARVPLSLLIGPIFWRTFGETDFFIKSQYALEVVTSPNMFEK